MVFAQAAALLEAGYFRTGYAAYAVALGIITFFIAIAIGFLLFLEVVRKQPLIWNALSAC